MKSNTLIIALVSFVVFSLNAQIIHVPANQPSIQAGINAATNGDTVLVDEGTYIENIRFMGKAITVASMYILDADTNHINNTIIDGSMAQNPDSAATVMFINGEDTTSILNGFTITGGSGVHFPNWQMMAGGGVYTYNSGSKIINNKVINNQVEGNQNAGGSGIQCIKGADITWAVIANNTISHNTSKALGYTAFGGGIGVTTNAIIKNNIIQYNECINENQYADGGGIEVDMIPGSPIITYIFNNIIQFNSVTGNSNSWGAGISFHNGSGVISNNLITNNETHSESHNSYGGGICIMVNCNVILQNITCANNTTETHGGGIYSESAPVEIINSILWDNAPNELGGSFLVSYSDIKSGGWPGAGNINLDPLFVGSGDYPYALQNDSPCVNTGIPDTTGLNLPEFDLAGNPRLYGGRIEMGAYENQNLAVGVEEFDSDSNRDLVGAFGVECYPNPFYNHTTIHHTLPNAGFVNLEIHNITGKKIKTLHSGFTPAGEHGFVWDAEGLKDGLYLMRLETDGISESRKLLLLQ